MVPMARSYAEPVLSACLATVPGLDNPETFRILPGAHPTEVLRSWIEGESPLCIVYRSPHYDGMLGLRRDVTDPDYEFDTPEELGEEIAYGDIDEPLGSAGDSIRVDVEMQPSLTFRPTSLTCLVMSVWRFRSRRSAACRCPRPADTTVTSP